MLILKAIIGAAAVGVALAAALIGMAVALVVGLVSRDDGPLDYAVTDLDDAFDDARDVLDGEVR